MQKNLLLYILLLGWVSVSAQVTAVVSHANGGASSGSIQLAINGKGPFNVQWAGTKFKSTEKNIYNINPGTYCVTITDNETCCTAEKCFKVKSDCEIDIQAYIQNETATGKEDGHIWLDAQGGTVPYTFLWGNGSSHQFENHLGEGNYCVTVTDDKGCTAEACFDVQNCNNTTIGITNIADDDGTGTGSLKVEAEGQAPYTYSWSGPNGYTATTQTVTNLPTGYYTVTVTNALGCSNILNRSICTGFKVIPPVIGEPCIGLSSFQKKERYAWCFENFV